MQKDVTNNHSVLFSKLVDKLMKTVCKDHVGVVSGKQSKTENLLKEI